MESQLSNNWVQLPNGIERFIVNTAFIVDIEYNSGSSHPYIIRVEDTEFQGIFIPKENIECKELDYAKSIVETSFRNWLIGTIKIFI